MRIEVTDGRLRLVLAKEELTVMETRLEQGQAAFDRDFDLPFLSFLLSSCLLSGARVTMETIDVATGAVLEQTPADHDDISRIVSLVVKMEAALA